MGEMIYLDNGATSFPKPEVVYTFMDTFYRKFGVNPGRSGFDLCIETGDLLEETRKMMASFFNGSNPERLCFGYNSTDSLNLIINGLLSRGDHAISSTLEHNSVLRPLYHKQIDEGVEVDYLPFDRQGFIDPDDIAKKIKKSTKLVIINHASNVIGTIQPITEIGKLCREKGILFAIDASQSAGKIPIDIEEQNLDIVAFTGHKSLMGPTGIGGLYVKDGVDIRLTRAGGTGVRSAVRTHLFDYPYRLEYGTPNMHGIAGLNAGVKWVMNQGISTIHKQEMRLTSLLIDGLKDCDDIHLHCQDDLSNHIGVVSFNINGLEASNTGTLLDVDYNIACRTGLHCAPLVHEQIGTAKLHGSVRFGIGPFNTESDITSAVEAIKSIIRFQKKRTKS